MSDLLTRTYFTDLENELDDDPAVDPCRKRLDELEQLLHFADTKASLLYADNRTKKTEDLRHHIAMAHLLSEEMLEEM